MKSNLIIVIPIVFLLFLSASVPILSTDTQLALGRNENREIQVELLLPADSAQSTIDILQPTLSESLPELKKQGIEAEWKPLTADDNGNIPFMISMKGKGYDLLNDSIFDGEQVLQVDSASPGKKRFLFNLQPSSDLFNSAINTTFTLRGAKVVATNGNKLNANTVQWENQNNLMKAVLEEPGSPSWLGYLLLFVGGGLLVIAILGLFGSFKKQPLPVTYSTAAYTDIHLDGPTTSAEDTEQDNELVPDRTILTPPQGGSDSNEVETHPVGQSSVLLPLYTDMTPAISSPEDVTIPTPEVSDLSTHEAVTETETDVSEIPIIYPKFCARCGLPWPTGANFCPRCRKPLN
jgi:hypothetical protein